MVRVYSSDRAGAYAPASRRSDWAVLCRNPSARVSIFFAVHRWLGSYLRATSRKRSTASRILSALVALLYISSTLGVITYVILLSLLLQTGVGAPRFSYLPPITKLDIAHAVTARLNVRHRSVSQLPRPQ